MVRRHFTQLLEISGAILDDAWLVLQQNALLSYEFWLH